MAAATETAASASCEGAECGLFALAKSAEVKSAEVKGAEVKGAQAKPAPSVSSPPLDPAFESDDDGPLYEARRKIYPQSVHGTYRRIKWIVLARHARHLLLHAVHPLGSRAECAVAGRADRPAELRASISSSSRSGRRRSTTSPAS